MIKISPKKIAGPWVDGYALDFHTVGSDFIGYDEYGHEKFDTKYTEIGELLYRLKSKKDNSVVEEIIEIATDFVISKKWSINLVIPVPPSNYRVCQPVIVLAEQVAKALSIEYCGDCVKKIKDTPQLKNVFDINERKKLLSGAFNVDCSQIEGKSVLVFDDLYRSGATVNEVCSALAKYGKAASVHTLTITRTRVYK